MDIETKLQVFHVLQMVCGVLAVALLILTVFIFIKMGIWQAILERSGVAKRKSTLQLQEINALTGRLHKSSAARVAEQEFTGQFTSDKKKKAKRSWE